MDKRSKLLFATFFTVNALTAGTNYQATGVASYYGRGFYNHLTASGERFTAKELTAAHRTLPFGTLVKVTSVRTKKSVIVRINDRGPVSRGKIIDLSEEAAAELGMLKSGIAKVTITVLDEQQDLIAYVHSAKVKKTAKYGRRKAKEHNLAHKGKAQTSYIVQAGSFLDHGNAVNAKSSLDSLGIENTSISKATVNQAQMYRLYIGPFASMEEVEELLRRLRAENVKAFVLSMKN
jgi:rare lipoprotein A